MQLVEPSIQYKDSFIEAVGEYQAEEDSNKHFRNTHYKELQLADLHKDFHGYVNRVLAKARGENLPEGYVPESTFWLVDGNRFIGRISIRHGDTPFLLKVGGHIGYDIRPTERGKGFGNKILELALPKAKELGFNKILITCNDNNIPSKKVIEANGGVFENSVTVEGGPDKLRYWINL